VFPLYEIAFGSLKKKWKAILPYLIVGIFITISLFNKIEGKLIGLKIYNYVQPGFDNPLLKIPISITEYLRLMFWPGDLSLYRSELIFTLPQYLTRLGIFLILLLVIGISYRKKRYIFFWLLFFIITLLPTLTPYRFASTVAERYVYVGSLGIFAVVGMILNNLSENEKLKKGVYFIFVVLILALSVRTIVRNRDWLSEDNLWIASAKVSPNDPNVLNNLGDMYTRHKDYQKAIESLSKAIKLKPDYADAYHNLANSQATLYSQEKNEEYLKLAIDNYFLAIKYNPLLWQSHQNLGVIYFNIKQYDKAIEQLNKAIEINPSNLNLQYNLGIVYLNSDNTQKAKEIFSSILQKEPDNQTIIGILKQIK
ncbi:MAG: tetratricopeptide repeat protein, partial [bacterium]